MKMSVFKKSIVIMLAVLLLLPAFLVVEAKADENPSLSNEKMTIGTGSYGIGDSGYFHKKKTRYVFFDLTFSWNYVIITPSHIV